jgi:hypothetical protein
VLITILVSSDGESNWLEGAALQVVYVILGLAFFLCQREGFYSITLQHLPCSRKYLPHSHIKIFLPEFAKISGTLKSYYD